MRSLITRLLDTKLVLKDKFDVRGIYLCPEDWREFCKIRNAFVVRELSTVVTENQLTHLYGAKVELNNNSTKSFVTNGITSYRDYPDSYVEKYQHDKNTKVAFLLE